MVMDRDTYMFCVDEVPGYMVNRMVVGVDVEQGWGEYPTLCQAILLFSPFAAFVV